MSFAEKGADEMEAIVDTLTIEGASLTEANLTTLTSSEIQQLNDLSSEIHFPNDMETDESEVIIETADEQQVDLGGEEVEVETEHRSPSPELILPDARPRAAAVPPLRPLTIAPKPAKLPLGLKPLPAGQQLVFLQSGGAGQAIKLVSPQGQELSLANFQIGRPMTLKPAGKALAAPGVQLVQPKQIVMKKFVAGKAPAAPKPGHVVVVQKPHAGASPTKTITIQQAQEMGLLTTKMMPQAQSTPKHAVVVNKGMMGSKQIKIIPTTSTGQLISPKGMKSPAKILPAALQQQTATTSRAPQKIIFKHAQTGQTILPSAQLIQVAGHMTSGQLHQVNIPGKGMQYIKFVTATGAETVTQNVISTVKTTLQSAQPTPIILNELKPAQIAPKPLKTIAAKTPTSATAAAPGQLLVLPNYVQAKVPIPMRLTTTQKTVQAAPPPLNLSAESTSPNASVEANLESNGMRPRKPCNCTKSQCLKLYCDCFANGEFCYLCNCMNCYNNLENEDMRQRAIKACLERNPTAFRPKIGKAKDMRGDSSIRKHTKGCNCKRSGCLKNYCECYEAKIACSSNCKCVGCRNIEDSMDKKGMVEFDEEMGGQQMGEVDKLMGLREMQIRPRRISTSNKQAINFINDDVVEATSQCMLTISHSGESNMQEEEVTKGQIIEEFARCLKEIIDCSTDA